MVKRYYILIVLGLILALSMQAVAQQDLSQPAVIKIDEKDAADTHKPDKGFSNQQIISAEGFSYYTTSSGIYISFPKPNNYVRLFALTGQLIWSGELVSGRFFIPTGEGIFFLRVNNKSYKVSCKKM